MSHIRRILIGLTVSVFTNTLIAQSSIATKQVAAPPSDILNGTVTLPNPESLAVRSTSALIPIPKADRPWQWSMDFVLGNTGTRIAFLQDKSEVTDWSVELIDPQSNRSSPNTYSPRVSTGKEFIPWLDPTIVFDHVTIHPRAFADDDRWTLILSGRQTNDGFVLIDTGTDITLSTHVVNRSTLIDQTITMQSELNNDATFDTISARIVDPSGTEHTIEGNPHTGTIKFTPTLAGSYRVSVLATGTSKSGSSVVLSTQHLIDVVLPALPLGNPTTRVDDELVIFTFDQTDSQRRTILAAEVWGERNDEQVPVAWISSVVQSDRELVLDHRWIVMGQVNPETLELRNVRIHDIDSLVPLEVIDHVRVPVEVDTSPTSAMKVDDSMLMGSLDRTVTAPLSPQIGSMAGPGHRLFLVHGYCTDANPYPTSHFTGDLAVFEDFNQSRSHDSFALQILAQSIPMKSFGVVAHSQGGMASLHLRTFYWSGLDWAKGNRLIQSVGTPYQGTALAGNAAVLGDIFGVGCGENPDLTYSGAANWLSLIPTWAREDVWYHTTSFDDGIFYDYCNLITDLLLSDPDDGVTERSSGQLTGANNMGHIEGWCHSQGMRDPAQCTDQSRNSIMNQEAAR